jgi:predicted ATPase/DNA-binding CsgD family transcriptional regulator/Flp pilus assembly protein TadD
MAIRPVLAPAFALVGRQDELARIHLWLSEPAVRLVTVVGMGGIGKTRLAQEVARSWSGALVWVRLDDVADSENSLLSRLGQTLELPECPWDEWHTRLDTVLPGPTLIVFDNLEHLRRQASSLSDLIARHPQVQLLVTSRSPLLISGERLLNVDPLDNQAAISLFLERARAVRPDFSVGETNQKLVENLCQRTDGIPLSLELAAARLRHLGLGELYRSLEDSLELLSGGGPDRPPRQQTLTNTLDWSYRLLTPAEQNTFRILSVFRGGFDTEALKAVGGGASELLSLSDHSLVWAQPTSTGESRFTLLETVRTYAHGLLAQGGGEDYDLAHARYYENLATRVEGWRGGPSHADGLKLLARERGNLSKALETFKSAGQYAEALSLAGALGWYWEACSLLQEGRSVLEGLLAKAQSPLALHYLATLLRHQGDYDSAATAYQGALVGWRELRLRDRVSETLSGLGQLRFREGQYAEAKDFFVEALAQGDERRQVEATNGLGRIAWVEGRLDHALQLEMRSLDVANELQFPLGEAWAHNALGEVYRSRKEREQAAHHFRAAAEIFRHLHEFSLAALSLQNLAYVELGRSNWEAAERGFQEALPLWRQAGARHGLALCLIGLAGVLAGRKRDILAARFLGTADRLLESIGVQLEASDQLDYQDIEKTLDSRLGDQLHQIRQEPVALDFLLTQLRPEPLNPGSLLDGLTHRELEVLKITTLGASNKEIADRLSISPQTVMTHLRSIFRKLDVTSRTAAARWANEHGILPDIR